MQDATVHAHCLILLKNAMCTQLGQPDVEEVMTLCLCEEKKEEEVIMQQFTDGILPFDFWPMLDYIKLIILKNCYLQVINVISRIQVYSFGLLVDRHNSMADIQRAMQLPSHDLLTNTQTFHVDYFENISLHSF